MEGDKAHGSGVFLNLEVVAVIGAVGDIHFHGDITDAMPQYEGPRKQYGPDLLDLIQDVPNLRS